MNINAKCPLLIILSLTIVGPAAAQGHVHSDVQIIEEVDGTKNPAAIPDVVAFHHFIGVLMVKTATRAADESRRNSYLEANFRLQCGPKREDRTLTRDESRNLLSAVDEMTATLGSLEKSLGRTLTADDVQTPLNEMYASMPFRLGPIAWAKIQAHMNDQMKPKMKLIRALVPAKNQP